MPKPLAYDGNVEPDELKRLREQIGLSQPEFAAELGVHPMTVSRWERGERGIPEPVARLAERLARERKQRDRKEQKARKRK